MRIKVKRKHIRRGVRNSDECCPVALAIYQATGIADVSVIEDQAWIEDYVVKLPKKVNRFIDRFDGGKSRRKMKPFSFKFKFKKS